MVHAAALAGAIIWLGLNGLLWYTRPSDLLWLRLSILGAIFFGAPQHRQHTQIAPIAPRDDLAAATTASIVRNAMSTSAAARIPSWTRTELPGGRQPRAR